MLNLDSFVPQLFNEDATFIIIVIILNSNLAIITIRVRKFNVLVPLLFIQ